MNLLKRLVRKFKVPDSYLINKLFELDDKGKSDSLRAKAIIKKLIKRGYPQDLFDPTAILADEDDEFFEDDGVFDEEFFEELAKENLSKEELLSRIFGPRIK